MANSERSSLISQEDNPSIPRWTSMSVRSSGILIGFIICVFAAVGLILDATNSPVHTVPESEAAKRLPMLSSSKASKESKSEEIEEYDCESDNMYSKHTVKTAYELPFASLFKNNKGQKKFEASSVTIVGDSVYAVCDSSFAISKFDDRLLPFSEGNMQLGSPDRDGDVESGYEAIFHHDGLFYVVRESILHHNHDDNVLFDEDDRSPIKAGKTHSFHAIIEELVLGDDDYTVQSACKCEFEFEGTSKGFEGAIGFPDASGELFILGLCEGNHCSEERKADVGHGRVVLMKKNVLPDPYIPGGCTWETVRVIHIPRSAEFLDYSAIDITADGRVAITSQENSALWVGTAVGIEKGVIDPDAFEFVEDSGVVYQFQKSDDCHTIYCNIEGIHWMNNEMLMGVSDKMKGKGKQNYRCFDKDQSIHAFVLP